MFGHHSNHSSSSLNNVNWKEDIDVVVGTAAAAVTGDQLAKAAASRHHRLSHLVKAGLGAVVTLGAIQMVAREHHEKKQHEEEHHNHEHHGDEHGGNASDRVTIIEKHPRRRSYSDHEDRHRLLHMFQDLLDPDGAERRDRRYYEPTDQEVEVRRRREYHRRHRSYSPRRELWWS